MFTNQQQRPAASRSTSYRGGKRALLGNPGPAPAWRMNASPAKEQKLGSKILLSYLPKDVQEEEIRELFINTVGPLKDVLIVYNSHGVSNGMAVVTFQRHGDAGKARDKYNGKIVDGKNPIKIEIIVDGTPGTLATPTPLQPSLLSRLGGPGPAPRSPTTPRNPLMTAVPPSLKPKQQLRTPIGPAGRRRHLKKGAKRVKKTAAQLDQDMDDYRAGSHGVPASGKPEA
ncbi:hypothetical protein PUNSTDRAFT_144039 [Punctularia strigosozonata HHB-11173 SS5]|uniref:uncharacterized protein n=1 Tax=Punctularia strigosozonata (strain HHB-11173) TaxID=741275 RepID=UPI0004417F50|nr:uncharacterized protein PUNSTDRAFT_144039 [Punctularia strigosozonata HHB-11173 SS5]EIN08453.1 hypothetical protein PUNSTDRAFT_144039 [Punctularia strigosozonata HHB-11173 SS5]